MKSSFIILVIVFFASCNNKDVDVKETHQKDLKDKISDLVLSENDQGIDFVFEKKTNSDNFERYVSTFIGSIESADGKLYFVSTTSFTGRYFKAASRIYLYNKFKVPIGYYDTGGSNTNNPSIDVDNLVLDYSVLPSKIKTSISFKDGIPDKILVKYNEDEGDLFTFTRY